MSQGLYLLSRLFESFVSSVQPRNENARNVYPNKNVLRVFVWALKWGEAEIYDVSVDQQCIFRGGGGCVAM